MSREDVFNGNVKVRFRNQEDIDEFSKLVKQFIHNKQQNYWFPEDNEDLEDLFE